MAGSPDQSDESFDFEDDEEIRTFWAVELIPGKEYTSQVPADLHITTAVLPASAKDAVRSVVSVTTDEEPEKSFAIVSLKLDSHESQTLDVMIDAGTIVKLTLAGSTKNHVHLSGYYVNLPGGEDFGSDDDEEGMFGEEDEEESDDEEDISPEMMKKLQELEKKRKVPQNGGEGAKKAKVEGAKETPKKTEGKPQQPKQQTPKGDAKPQAAKTPQSGQKPAGQQQPKVHPNGLQTTIIQEGSGAVATKGKRVSVKYIGKLTKNGKVFDASQNKPFTFKLGAREVITGWDVGVEGMKVGEKRKLVIPANLAYGSEGAGGDIPPNASLTFDVELVNVK